MNDFLLNLVGFDFSRVPEGAKRQLVLTNEPHSWQVFLMIAVVLGLIYGVLHVYRRELDTCPRWARIFLAVVRSAVLLVLAAVFLGPALAISQTRTVAPDVFLLLDTSQSMNLPDRYLDDEAVKPVVAATGRSAETIRAETPSRAKLVQEVFAKDDHALMRALAKRGNLHVLGFDGKTTPLELEPIAATEPTTAASAPIARHPAAQASYPSLWIVAGLGLLISLVFLTLRWNLAAIGCGLVTIALAAAALRYKTSETPQTPTTETVAQTAPVEDVKLGLPPLKPLGTSTLIAKAIRESSGKSAGNRVAAIVVVSDGQDTAKDDSPLALADAQAAQKTPIFTLGVGDPSKPRNLSVREVFADEQTWRGDPFEIQAVVEGQGLDQNTIQVELVEQPLTADGVAQGNATTIETRSVTLPAGGGRANLSFKHTQKKEGLYSYIVQTPVLKDELLDSDNSKSVKVRVLKEQARVLLIAGSPTWEYRLVSGLFTRDPTIDVSCWLQSMDKDMTQEGKTPIVKLPYTLEELAKYDLVMMFDPDPDEFNEAWFETLKKFVGDHSGGFLYLAGPKYSSRFLTEAKTKELRDLLPVRLPDPSAMELDSIGTKNNREFPLGVVLPNLDHPIMRFDTDLKNNQARWEKMPGIFWSFPALEAKPAARVLLEHTDPNLKGSKGARPLLVTGQYSSGRTAYIGFNGSWRWRSVGKDAEFFNKFWVQTARFLVEGKLLASKRRGTIETNGDKFHAGDQVQIGARLTDPAFQPLALPSIKATVRSSAGKESQVELKPVTAQPGQYSGVLTASAIGANEITITLTGDKPTDSVSIVKPFEVELPRVEFEDTRLNKALLKDLADRSGGQYFDLDHAGEIAAAIPDRSETITVMQKPAELWDTARILMLVVGLLTVEWAVRKRFKLM